MIARADGSVLYNFAVAVDDADMGITDVIRGDDHLSNTPRQLLVLAALGEPAPRYAHLPLLHGPDGKKLSKRHGAASVQELREAGYLPAAVRNYLALLGWGTEDDETIMSTDELVERFSIDRVGRVRGDLRRAEAALAQRPLHARGRTSPTTRRRSPRTCGAPTRRPRSAFAAALRRLPARGLLDRPGEGADGDRGLAADRVPVHRPADRREGLGEGDEAGGRRAAREPRAR